MDPLEYNSDYNQYNYDYYQYNYDDDYSQSAQYGGLSGPQYQYLRKAEGEPIRRTLPAKAGPPLEYYFNISRNLLTRLSKHYQTEGLAQPSKKSGGRRSNTRSLKYQDTEAVKKFICHYAEDHAVSLLGRVPGFKREDIRLLPSAIPKSGIYRQYADHANQAGLRVVGASTFRQLWLELCPYIVVAKPMTDLCWRCQRNNGRIFRGTFITDEEKNELILEQQRHLSQVNGERQLYQQMTAEAKEVVQQHGLQRLQRVVFYKTTIADEEQQFQHSVPDPYAALAPMPALIPPPLLSHARRQYLFNSIRQYVRGNVQDIVCPDPGQHHDGDGNVM
ncbi:hypothetical protein ACOMHN_035871 [Nucella lapillus]